MNSTDGVSDEEVARRRDAAIRRALNTPPNPKPVKAAQKKAQTKRRRAKPKSDEVF